MLYIVILCKTNEKTKKTTETCLQSINESDLNTLYMPFNQLHTIVVESGEMTTYNCSKTIKYDCAEFNYNHACNLALDYIKHIWHPDDWVCFMNNDIVCSKDWIKELALAKQLLPTVQSLCPNIGLVDAKDSKCKLLLGHMLKKTFNGCCFMLSCEALSKLGRFDEAFSFYFQDDDLLEWMKANNIQHGIAIDSHIVHIGQDTTGPEDIDKLVEGAQAFIKKYSLKTYLEIESGKLANINFNKLKKSE